VIKGFIMANMVMVIADQRGKVLHEPVRVVNATDGDGEVCMSLEPLLMPSTDSIASKVNYDHVFCEFKPQKGIIGVYKGLVQDRKEARDEEGEALPELPKSSKIKRFEPSRPTIY
jgi:hypothetical protein